MNHKEKFGYSRSDMLCAVHNNVISGQGDKAKKLFTVSSPKKTVAKLKTRLELSSNWECDGEVVCHNSKTFLQGIASWNKTVTAEQKGIQTRFRILQLDRFGERTVYAIPIKTKSYLTLPDMNLSDKESRVIEKMADFLSKDRASGEIRIEIERPAVPMILHHQSEIHKAIRPDANALIELLKQLPFLFSIVITALDVQLRSFKTMHKAPIRIHNYFSSAKITDAIEWLEKLLRVVTFANNSVGCRSGAIRLTVKEAGDWKAHDHCSDRMVLVHCTTAMTKPLLERMERRERQLMCGGTPDTPLSTIPVLFCRGPLQSPLAVDVELPADMGSLTDDQSDLLRAAVARTLSRDSAKAAYRAFNARRAQPDAYRLDDTMLWRECLINEFIRCTLPEDKRSAMLDLWHQKKSSDEAQEAVRKATLRAAYALLCDPDAYQEEIADKPHSSAAAEELLDSKAVCFRYTPEKGNHKGTHLLVFSESSLKRLLSRIQVNDALYELFLDTCEQSALLIERKHKITLAKGDTYYGISFSLDGMKCQM